MAADERRTQINADKTKAFQGVCLSAFICVHLRLYSFLRYVGNWRDRGEKAAFTKSIAVLVAASASPSRTGTTILTSEVSLRWYRMESAINQNLAANSPAIDRKSTRLNSSH